MIILTVLGIDLASARWQDNGVATLTFRVGGAEPLWVAARLGAPRPAGALTSAAAAQWIDTLARDRGPSAVSLDGPRGGEAQRHRSALAEWLLAAARPPPPRTHAPARGVGSTGAVTPICRLAWGADGTAANRRELGALSHKKAVDIGRIRPPSSTPGSGASRFPRWRRFSPSDLRLAPCRYRCRRTRTARAAADHLRSLGGGGCASVHICRPMPIRPAFTLAAVSRL
jgi:hypothetical protein